MAWGLRFPADVRTRTRISLMQHKARKLVDSVLQPHHLAGIVHKGLQTCRHHRLSPSSVRIADSAQACHRMLDFTLLFQNLGQQREYACRSISGNEHHGCTCGCRVQPGTILAAYSSGGSMRVPPNGGAWQRRLFAQP